MVRSSEAVDEDEVPVSALGVTEEDCVVAAVRVVQGLIKGMGASTSFFFSLEVVGLEISLNSLLQVLSPPSFKEVVVAGGARPMEDEGGCPQAPFEGGAGRDSPSSPWLAVEEEVLLTV